jgi:plastocyanin
MTARRSRSWRNLILGVATSISLVMITASALAATMSVSIKNFAFNPTAVSIRVGDKVTWTNNEASLGGPMHTVTSDDGHSFDSGNVNPGSSYSVTFNKAGTFAYHCNIHSNMHGTITVTGATTSPTPTPTPTHSRIKPTATATAKPVVPVSPTPTSSVKPSPRVSKTVKHSTPPTTSPSASPSRVVAAGSSSSSGADGTLAWIAGILIVAVAGGTFVLRRRRTNT